MRPEKTWRNKRLIMFDLDGTLTETKSDMDAEMGRLLCRLLRSRAVAIIGGARYRQFRTQFVAKLRCPKDLLRNLFLFPTTATSFYRYRRGWKMVYRKELSKREKAMIRKAFGAALREVGYKRPRKIYGKVIEDRGTQVAFSALGQDVVKELGRKGVELKKKWRDENTALKLKIARAVQKRLPGLEVRAAGYTTIDVTRKGIDKAYGVRQIKKHLGILIKDMLFVGDALFKGGNDYAARKTGVECVQVSGPGEAKKIISFLVSRS